MSIEQLLEEGYYIREEKDDLKKIQSYSLVKDISETERTIFCELNRAAYLKAKKLGFKVKSIEVCFLNFTPFASRNKKQVPMMEQTVEN